MRFSRIKLRRLLLLATAGAFLPLGIGCGQSVREDRTITWAPEGQAVGFQHGQEGVFVADEEGGKLRKIFQPGTDVCAASTPLWCPVGRRVIFTTARDNSEQQPVAQAAVPDPHPDGTFYHQRPVRYTCWLWDAADRGRPKPLFDASCDHVGYVAANLAVGWHPQGDRVFYIDQVAAGEHGLFEFDVAAKKSRRVFPHSAEAMLFDWTPDGSHLVLVLGSRGGNRQNDGIWIGQAGDWWQVPASKLPPDSAGTALLELLRSARPAWTPDGRRFAFVSYQLGTTPRCSLRLGTLPARHVEVLATDREPLGDLHWAPDGMRLGVVRGRENGSLHLLSRQGGLSPAINRKPVRRFAGWGADGKHLAYLTADSPPPGGGATWALLFQTDAHARDAVYLADGAGNEAGHEVFSGMRVTFPQWSPRGEKLSLWLTFSPNWRSWLSHLFGLGLHEGDPAVVFEPATGKLTWLATSAWEKVQVGHYHLLKREYGEAWKWYEQAERELPPPRPATPGQFAAGLENLVGPRDFTFFQYYCLARLGRHKEAQAKLEQFRRNVLPRTPAPEAGAGEDSSRAWPRELLDPHGLAAPLLRDLYTAEVFLSLDAGADGESFFRKATRSAATDVEQLSSACVLGQILLLENKRAAYLKLATDALVPLLLKVAARESSRRALVMLDNQPLIDTLGRLTLLPLYAPAFLAQLPPDLVRTAVPRWRVLREVAPDDTTRLEVDLLLHAAYRRLGMEQERQRVAARLGRSPRFAEVGGLLTAEGVSDALKKVRETIAAVELLHEWLSRQR